MQHYKSSGELKALAREKLLGNYSLFISAFVITSIIRLILNTLMMIPSISYYDSLLSKIIHYLIALIINVLFIILEAGLSYFALTLCRNGSPKISNIFYFFKNQSNHVVILGLFLSVIYTLASMPLNLVADQLNGLLASEPLPTGFFPLFSFSCIFALVVSTLSDLYFTFLFYLLLDHPEMSAKEIITHSIKLMKGHKFSLFYLNISFLGISFLGLLSCGIGFLWLIPYVKTTFTYFYMDLKGELS